MTLANLNRQRETKKKPEIKEDVQLFDILPPEMLDMILRKSYLLCILNKSESIRQKDTDIILALASVNYFWFQWITRKKFKRSVWRHLKVYYDEAKKTTAIIRNNRNYLMETIQPTEEFLALLLSVYCLNEEQVLSTNGLELKKDKNCEILRIIGSADERGYKNFIRCLRQTKQRNIARVVETGGVVLKARLLNFESKQKETEAQPSLQKLNGILINNMDHNQKTKSLICQMEKDDIHILSSSIANGKGIILWIWCRSQNSLEKLHEMYDANRLHEILRNLFSTFPSGLEFSKQMKLRIDSSYFGRNVSVRSIDISNGISFNAKLEMERNREVRGVTKLWNQIHVLCQSGDWSSSKWISVFENENRFRLQKKMEINEIKYPADIGSSEKENCLYVSDWYEEKKSCIWQIKESEDGGHQVTKWLMDIKSNYSLTLSVSSDGQLLTSVGDGQSSSLLIYGPHAELRRTIPLSSFDGHDISHAVETSKGNFIICHRWLEKMGNKGTTEETKDEEEDGKEEKIVESGVSELTRDKSVIHRFIPKDENQELDWSCYLSLDSDDQLILTDYSNKRVILFDSDLKWNRILIPTEEDKRKRRWIEPYRLCYDGENNQLIIAGMEEVYVYCLNWK